jgi:hypothetical protein
MIPLYDINSHEIMNIPAYSPNKSNTTKLILSTLIALTIIGLGLYVSNKKTLNTKYEAP